MRIPRLVIAGLSGDSGKTIVSLSLLAVLRQKALSVSAFKKGPDFIDAAWLTRVAGKACRNLDSYMVDNDRLSASFRRHAGDTDLALIEGNRGLYDGKDFAGTHSTAALARLLQAPVVLVVNCTKTTRTVAALVKGCIEFEPETNVVGVVLNRVAGKRHEATLRTAITEYCGIPVVGVIPKLRSDAGLIPGRHLGLVPPAEFGRQDELMTRLIEIGESYLDIDALVGLAETAPELEATVDTTSADVPVTARIGYFCDPVFTFYYPENLEALQQSGAELVPISSLTDPALPKVDGLYIGGGFPETFAERLAANRSLLKSVREAAEAGMPIYAECGGLIYLAASLRWQGKSCSLAGVFPVELTLQSRPVGHGYTLLEVDRKNPFFKPGTKIKGHEFHYTGLVAEADPASTCCAVRTGVGIGQGRDGLLHKSTLACYTHIHADSVPEWATAMVENARRYRHTRADNSTNDLRQAGDVAVSPPDGKNSNEDKMLRQRSRPQPALLAGS